MRPSIDTYTIAMPWYERDDFDQLLALADDRDEMIGEYDVWLEKARSVAGMALARGKALQFVTIRPLEFLAWIKERGLLNTTENRLRYVETLAAAVALPTDNDQLPLKDSGSGASPGTQ